MLEVINISIQRGGQHEGSALATKVIDITCPAAPINSYSASRDN